MEPIKFKGHNTVLAEDQPEYLPLPVCNEHDGKGSMVHCWHLTWKERLRLLFTGRIFFRQLTFGGLLQPVQPMTEWEEPRCINCGGLIGDHKAKKGYICPSKLN